MPDNIDTSGHKITLDTTNLSKQLEWVYQNREHPLLLKLHVSIGENEGLIKNGLEMSLGIVVAYLSELPAEK